MKAKLILIALSMCLHQSHADTLFVSNLNDSGTGSLRQAVMSANEGDVIEFQSSLLLNGSDTIKLLSEIAITKSILIKGYFAPTDTIYISGRNSNRTFSVQGNDIVVYFKDLVLMNGYADFGGAIICYNADSVSLENCTIRNCSANGPSYWHYGGAVYSSVPLYLSSCAIVNNLAAPSDWAYGGGIYCSATLRLTNTIISNNTASGLTYGFGGGIYCSATLRLSNSSIANNSASGLTYGNGGGIYCEDTLLIMYSTISNNSAIGGHFSRGGGLYARADVELSNTTICANECITTDTTSIGLGSAIFAPGHNGYTGVRIKNSTIYSNSSISNNPSSFQAQAVLSNYPISVSGSIVACNYPNEIASDNGVISLGYNIFSDSNNIQLDTTDILNATAQNLKLEPLAYYGGITKTLRPKVNSIAINNGNPLDLTHAQNIPIKNTRERGAAENCARIVRDVQTACKSYTWIDGNTYTYSSDTVAYILPFGGGNGCDIAIILEITISPNRDVIQQESVLTALETNCTYQWLDCNNGFAIIPGATSKSYNVTQNGSYAVELQKNGCIDTSSCILISSIGIDKIMFGKIALYPNPNSGAFTIELSEITDSKISIFNSNGINVLTEQHEAKAELQIDFNGPPGVYHVVVSTITGSRTLKLVIVED